MDDGGFGGERGTGLGESAVEGQESGGHVVHTLSREVGELQLTHLHWSTARHLWDRYAIASSQGLAGV